jgi:hypothetical protein
LKQPLSHNTTRGAAVKLEKATQANNTARGAAVKLEADTSSKTTTIQACQFTIKQKQTNNKLSFFQKHSR